MAFQDLLYGGVLAGLYIDHTLGAHAMVPFQAEEYPGGPLMDWRAGYVARAVLNDEAGANVMELSSINGRVQFGNPAVDGYTYRLVLLPSDRAALEPHVGRALKFNLLVTATGTGWAVDAMRDCFIRVHSAND